MKCYEVRPRKDKRGVDLISDVSPFGRLWFGEPNAVANAIGYAKHFSRSHHAVICVYDDGGNMIQTQEHAGEFKEFQGYTNREAVRVRLHYLEGMGSLSVEEILAAGAPP